MKPSIRISHILSLLAICTCISFALQPDSFFDNSIRQLAQRGEPDTLHQLYKRETVLDDTSSTKGKKSDQGTKDAPVDGADGKPHAGPFVDSTDADASSKSPKEKASKKEKTVPEDGVMNDPHRAPPKKGTTGTEGGVSEKSKNREAHENETGRKKVQKPEAPKDADSVPHKEEDPETVKKADQVKSAKGSDKSAQQGSKSDETDEKPKGAVSIEVDCLALYVLSKLTNAIYFAET